jgi:hypothetical protein
MGTALPARADIGVQCAGWEVTTVEGVRANPCYLRTAVWTIRGRGKAYYEGWRRISYLAIAVQLQKSLNGVNSWVTQRSNVCGWNGDEIANEAPGNICNTASINVDAGYVYRTRMLVVVEYASGGMETSEFAFSELTT